MPSTIVHLTHFGAEAGLVEVNASGPIGLIASALCMAISDMICNYDDENIRFVAQNGVSLSYDTFATKVPKRPALLIG